MRFEIIAPVIEKFVFTWQWLVDLLTRVFGDTFDFVGEENNWAE